MMAQVPIALATITAPGELWAGLAARGALAAADGARVMTAVWPYATDVRANVLALSFVATSVPTPAQQPTRGHCTKNCTPYFADF